MWDEGVIDVTECEDDESAMACVTSCLRWAYEKRLKHRSKEIVGAHLGSE